MKLLFIHEVNYETKVIFEIHEFPELLALRGHEIHYIHFPEKIGIRKFNLRSKVKTISGRAYPEAKIQLINPPSLGGSFVDRVLATIYTIPLLYKQIKKEKYDAIVLFSVPTTGWQTALLAKRFETPILFRALDVSHLLRSAISKKLVFWAERVVYRNVNVISANNSALAEYCVSHNAQYVPIVVNVPPLDLEHFHKAKNDLSIRANYKILPDDFVLMFMGTLYEFSGLNQVINDFARIRPIETKLVIVGGGKDEVKLRNLVADLQLSEEVLFTGVIPYNLLPEVLGIADVAINSFVPSLVTDVAFPHKVLQYLAAGLVTVSTKLEGLYDSLGENAGIYWVDETSQVLEKALDLRTNPSTNISEIRNLGRAFIQEKFNKEKAVSEFENAIEGISCESK
jgi:glycosyltransferase involved in cell wall biosynthesis